MKRLLYTFLSFSLLTSCMEKDVTYLLEPDEKRQLVVNALWSTNDTVCTFNVCRTGTFEVEENLDYEAVLTVNGVQLASTRGSKFDYQPKPGDEVELRVSCKGETVKAQVDVLQPIIIESIDTLRVRKVTDYENGHAEDYLRYMIHLRMPKGMHGMQYFRLEHDREITTYSYRQSYYDEETDSYVTKVQLWNDYYHEYEYDFDPAMSENGDISGSDESDMALVDVVPNRYGLFRSSYFQQGRYTLYVDIPFPHGERCISTFRVLTISKMEFNYLWAATALYEVYEPGVLLSNPPIVPTNIEGGTGIFSIGAAASAQFVKGELSVDKERPIYTD